MDGWTNEWTDEWSNGPNGVDRSCAWVGVNLDNAEPTTCVNRVIAERLAKDGLPLREI